MTVYAIQEGVDGTAEDGREERIAHIERMVGLEPEGTENT